MAVLLMDKRASIKIEEFLKQKNQKPKKIIKKFLINLKVSFARN